MSFRSEIDEEFKRREAEKKLQKIKREAIKEFCVKQNIEYDDHSMFGFHDDDREDDWWDRPIGGFHDR